MKGTRWKELVRREIFYGCRKGLVEWNVVKQKSRKGGKFRGKKKEQSKKKKAYLSKAKPKSKQSSTESDDHEDSDEVYERDVKSFMTAYC